MKASMQSFLTLCAAIAAWSGLLAQPVTAQEASPMQADEMAELKALEASVNDRLQKHHIREPGAEDPASIPYSSKMGVFFDLARARHSDPAAIAQRLQQRMLLDESDAKLLAAVILAEDEPPALRGITEQIRLLQTQLEELTDLSSAAEIGRQQNALHEEAIAVESAHVEAQLAPLSRNGRRTLEEHVNREVVPGMTHYRIDYAGLYAEIAELMPLIERLQAKGFLQVPEEVAAAYAAYAAKRAAATATPPASSR